MTVFQEDSNSNDEAKLLQLDGSKIRNKLNIVNLEYHKYPMDSVPVKVVLGKIEKIENPFLPKLHLAFLESE